MPHNLLDGAFYDERSLDQESLRLGIPASYSKRFKLRGLQAVQPELSNELRCECNGGARTNGKP